jgi:hypothetical protein
MSNRLDKDREAKLQPQRMQTAIDILTKLGFEISHNETEINFMYMGHKVHYFPYSGWATGSTIKDGRGLVNLLKQLK